MWHAFSPELHPNRERYELMLKRRQALLELARLRQGINQHKGWQEQLAAQPALAAGLETSLFGLEDVLCASFCQADSHQLELDIRHIYCQLIRLAKLWCALDDGDSTQVARIFAEHFALAR